MGLDVVWPRWRYGAGLKYAAGCSVSWVEVWGWEWR